MIVNIYRAPRTSVNLKENGERKKTLFRHLIVKLLKEKDKKKISKAAEGEAQGVRDTLHRTIRTMTATLLETMEVKKQWDIFKMLKKKNQLEF